MGKSVLTRLSRSLRSSQETARWTRSRLLADEMNYYRARTNAVLRAVQLDKVELENGSEAMRKVVCHPGGVSAAILTDKNEKYCLGGRSATRMRRRCSNVRRARSSPARIPSRR